MDRTFGKPKPATLRKPKLRYRVHGHHLHWVRGLLIAHWRRDVTLKAFADIIGITPRFYQQILSGDRAGGAKTLRGLLALREEGLMLHLSDFAEEVSSQEYQRNS